MFGAVQENLLPLLAMSDSVKLKMLYQIRRAPWGIHYSFFGIPDIDRLFRQIPQAGDAWSIGETGRPDGGNTKSTDTAPFSV